MAKILPERIDYTPAPSIGEINASALAQIKKIEKARAATADEQEEYERRPMSEEEKEAHRVFKQETAYLEIDNRLEELFNEDEHRCLDEIFEEVGDGIGSLEEAQLLLNEVAYFVKSGRIKPAGLCSEGHPLYKKEEK